MLAESVGVVVLDFNQRTITTRCLASLAQGDQIPAIVVLIENGSQSLDDLAVEPLHIVRLRPGRNLGCAGGRNFGLAYLTQNTSVGTFVVLDNDTVVPPEFLARVAALSLQNLEVAAPVTLDLATKVVWSCGGTITGDGSIEQLTSLAGMGPSACAEVDWSPGACLIMHRQAWTEIGPFDEWLNFLFEDIDWCVRVRRAGGRIVVHRNLELLHEANQSLGGRWSPERVRLWARNGTVFILTIVRPGVMANVKWIGGETLLAFRDLALGRLAWFTARLSGLGEGLRESVRRRGSGRSLRRQKSQGV
jgi:GT2 family glycosyltransferase